MPCISENISNYDWNLHGDSLSPMGCDDLKAPINFFIVHHLRIKKKSEHPIIMRMGWNTITRHCHDD